MPDKEPVYARIRYADDETGWAEELEDGRYKVANMPLAEDIQFGDIIEVEEGDGLRVITKVIERKYPVGIGVEYPVSDDREKLMKYWNKLCNLFQEFEIFLEGMVAGRAIGGGPAGCDSDEFMNTVIDKLDEEGFEDIKIQSWDIKMRGCNDQT